MRCVDPSVGMMAVGKIKIPHRTFIEAGAENISMSDESVDIISIAYGIRNVVKRKKVVQTKTDTDSEKVIADLICANNLLGKIQVWQCGIN